MFSKRAFRFPELALAIRDGDRIFGTQRTLRERAAPVLTYRPQGAASSHKMRWESPCLRNELHSGGEQLIIIHQMVVM